MSLADRIKQARKDAGLTQAELAEAMGIDQSTLSSLERGETKRTMYLIELSGVLQVNPLWLATGDGPQSAHPGASDDAGEFQRYIQDSWEFLTPEQQETISALIQVYRGKNSTD